MNILFVSTACSKKMQDRILNKNSAMYGIQGQKFMNLLLHGLTSNKTVNITTVSKYSNRKILDTKTYYPSIQESHDGLTYNYLPEHRYFSNLVPFVSNCFYVLKWIRSKKNKANKQVICDGLSFTLLISTLLVCKLTRTHVCTFVTDMPRFLVKKNKTTKYFYKAWESIIKLSDSFIFLTLPMNNELNKKNNKLYCIIEGLVDSSINNRPEIFKTRKKICLYAGSLKKIYGIEKLVHAFLLLKDNAYELHLYGGGDFEEELTNICANKDLIKYFGWKSNEEIIKLQQEITLLINPRPTKDDYTKYSFPSKTLEYMISGTPLLTTRLPSIPYEYNSFIYFFDDESVEGMARTIKTVLEDDEAKRFEKAKNAYNFAMNNKNNIVQAQKIISMFNTIHNTRKNELQ